MNFPILAKLFVPEGTGPIRTCVVLFPERKFPRVITVRLSGETTSGYHLVTVTGMHNGLLLATLLPHRREKPCAA